MPDDRRDAPVEVVVFDMDGVLVETEALWDAVRKDLARETGARWPDHAHTDMMGMSTPEWTGYMHHALGVPLAPDAIRAEVVARLSSRYREALPVIPGALAAVRRMAHDFRLGVASSSDRELVELVLELAGVRDLFAAVTTSEEVDRGKPAPDVYLEAVRRLGTVPGRAAAVEDSGSGIRAAAAAGLRVIAIPNRAYPPAPRDAGLADVVLSDIRGLSGDLVTGMT